MGHGGNLSLQWLSSLLPGLGKLLILALPEGILAKSLALWYSSWRVLKELTEGMVMIVSTLVAPFLVAHCVVVAQNHQGFQG